MVSGLKSHQGVNEKGKLSSVGFCLYLFHLEIESTSPKIVSMGDLSSLLICHVVAWVGRDSHPHQCLRQVGELALRS